MKIMKAWITMALRTFALALAFAGAAAAQTNVSIKDGDRVVSAVVLGEGEHAVIALHGAGGNKGAFDWISPALAGRGFKVISIDWPAGPGGPPPGMAPLAAAIRFAKEGGAKKVSLMGHSRGGELAARYASVHPDGELDSLILLASVDDQPIPLAKTKKLFVFSKNDRLARWSQVSADRSAEPKQVFALKGSAHNMAGLVSDKPDLLEEIAGTLSR
jgi:pimeloyl-ACP methyl ester carboxylesterase